MSHTAEYLRQLKNRYAQGGTGTRNETGRQHILAVERRLREETRKTTKASATKE